MLERICSISVFPCVLGGAVGWAIALMHQGVHPALSILAPQLAAMAVIIAFSHVFPHERDWNRSRHDFWTDAAHSLVSGLGATALVQLAVRSGGVAVAGFFSRELGSPFWPGEWPLVAQLVLALIVGELPQYAVHRLQHEREWFWRFHATHHSAPRLYWLNAGRFHPVDLMMNTFGWFALLVLLGVGEPVLALFALVSAVHGFFQHANLKLRLGPLNWFFSMAELHRWHHSRTLEESNTNYGQNLIVWDVVFGTRFLPNDREPPTDIGIADLPDFPMTWWAQLASPWRWQRIRAGAVRGPDAGSGSPRPPG